MSAVQAKQVRPRKNTLSRVTLPRKPETDHSPALELELPLEEADSLPDFEPESSLENGNRYTDSAPIRVWLYRACRFVIVSTLKSAWIVAVGFARYLRFHPAHAFFSAALLLVLGVLVATGSKIHEDLILDQISDRSVDEIVTASQFTRDFSLSGVGARGQEEFLRVGAPTWIQREAVRAVLFHARKEGLSIEDQAVLLATVEVESGFNPSAKAPTTTACGLFQFVRATGERYGITAGDCMNPWQNARAGVKHYLDNLNRTVQAKVTNLTGPRRVFRTFELTYYLHHDGPNSSNPSNDVKATVLGGTDFLFKAYDVLRREDESRNSAPSFYERFSENFVRTLHHIGSIIIPESAMQRASADTVPSEDAS